MPIVSGGSSFPVSVLGSTTTLTHAQILTLPTVPVQLVAAPGAGKWISPLSAYGIWTTSADYVMDAGAKWQLLNGAQESSGFVAPPLPPGLFGEHLIAFPPFYALNTLDSYLSFNASHLLTDYVNLPLYVADVYNGVPNYTGGGAGDTLTITVLYTILTA